MIGCRIPLEKKEKKRREERCKAAEKSRAMGKTIKSLDLGLPCAENLGAKIQDDPLVECGERRAPQ